MSTKEFIEKVKNHEIDIVEHTYKLIEECKEINKEYNYLNVISEELALNQAREIKIQLKQKNKKPSRDWLKIVKSAQARKHISTFLKHSEEDKKFEKRGGETVEFNLMIRDRVGLLRDVTHLLARHKINIKKVDTDTKNQKWASLMIHAQKFKNKTEVEKMMVRLKGIKGVEDVSYKLL